MAELKSVETVFSRMWWPGLSETAWLCVMFAMQKAKLLYIKAAIEGGWAYINI